MFRLQLHGPPPLGSGRLVPAGHDTLAENPPDNLQIEMEWMERFIMSPQVLCLNGLASNDNHEDKSSDIGDEAGVFQDPMTTVVSVRPEATEKWMDGFVVDLVECTSVSRTSAVARTFGPAVSEEFSPVLFAGGVAA